MVFEGELQLFFLKIKGNCFEGFGLCFYFWEVILPMANGYPPYLYNFKIVKSSPPFTTITNAVNVQ